MCFVVMMVSCAVIFISASEVSGVGGRCDLVFSVVWLSKNWISMRFVRAVFAFFCGDCPVFSTPTKAKTTLSQQNWGGRVRARWWWWWFSVLSLFFVFTSLRARLRPALGLAGVLELAMRLSYLRVVLFFY